jgi:hypothetical protein
MVQRQDRVCSMNLTKFHYRGGSFYRQMVCRGARDLPSTEDHKELGGDEDLW